MDRKLVSEQIEALQIEALEARRLAETLTDRQSILDLENYAAQLEAEAARLGARSARSADEILPSHRNDTRATLLLTHGVR